MTSTSNSRTRAPAPSTHSLAARIGEFLEAIDHPGPVTRDALGQYAELVKTAGPAGTGRYRAAVELTRRSPDLAPPTPQQLDDHVNQLHQRDQTAAAQKPPSRPTKPTPPWTRKRARQLLEATGISEPDPDLVEAYRPLAHAAGKPDTLRWRFAVKLARAATSTEDDVPAPGRPELERRVAQERARRRGVNERRRERLRPGAEVLAENDATAAAAYVAGYRAEHGTGPTWVELAEHLGWQPHAIVELVIARLTANGILTHTPEHRSLDVTETYRETYGRSMP